MRLLDEREQIRDRIKNARENAANLPPEANGEMAFKVRELAQMNPETATAQEVNALLHHYDGVGTSLCDECGKKVKAVFEFGIADYDGRWLDICPDCLRAAIRLLDQSPD